MFVVYLICLQAAGGLIIAMAIKKADNIIKGLAKSFSISLGCIFSTYFFNFIISVQFIVSVVLVMFSILMYSCTSKNNLPNSNVN